PESDAGPGETNEGTGTNRPGEGVGRGCGSILPDSGRTLAVPRPDEMIPEGRPRLVSAPRGLRPLAAGPTTPATLPFASSGRGAPPSPRAPGGVPPFSPPCPRGRGNSPAGPPPRPHSG